MKDKKDTPFFVGYLDMPRALERFYWPLTALMLLCSLLIGYGLASAQKSSPPASWDTAQTETIRGLLQLSPYPVLHRTDPADPDKIESVLLVMQGKFSADAVARELENQVVTVTGFEIRHGGWTMFEITGAEDIQPDQPDQPGSEEIAATLSELGERVAKVSMGPVTLSGEIVDSKCYLGVMKPGEGPVHRACAEVCLLGGMPTMLVVRGMDNYRYGYVLTDSDGANVSAQYAALASDHYQITGELVQKGDLLYIEVSSALLTTEISQPAQPSQADQAAYQAVSIAQR